MIPEWSEESFLYRVPSLFPSRWVKKVFVRVPSLISQRGGKANRIPFQSVFLATGGGNLEVV